MAFCNKCGAELAEGSVFCRKCGAKQALAEPEKIFCHKCGTEQLSDSMFCRKCGTKLVSENIYDSYTRNNAQTADMPYSMSSVVRRYEARGLVDARIFDNVSDNVRDNCIKLNENAHKCRNVRNIKMCRIKNGIYVPAIIGRFGKFRIGNVEENTFTHIKYLSNFHTAARLSFWLISTLIWLLVFYPILVIPAYYLISRSADFTFIGIVIMLAILAVSVFPLSAVQAAFMHKDYKSIIPFIYNTLNIEKCTVPSTGEIFKDFLKFNMILWVVPFGYIYIAIARPYPLRLGD